MARGDKDYSICPHCGGIIGLFENAELTLMDDIGTPRFEGEVDFGKIEFSDYALTRAQDGSLTWVAPGLLGDGVVGTWDVILEGLPDFTIEVAGKFVPSDPSEWDDELKKEFIGAYLDIHCPRP